LLWSNTLGFMDIWRGWRKHHETIHQDEMLERVPAILVWEWINSSIRQRKKGDLWTFKKKRMQNRFCSNCSNLNNIPVSTTAARCSATDLATHEYAQFQPAHTWYFLKVKTQTKDIAAWLYKLPEYVKSKSTTSVSERNEILISKRQHCQDRSRSSATRQPIAPVWCWRTTQMKLHSIMQLLTLNNFGNQASLYLIDHLQNHQIYWFLTSMPSEVVGAKCSSHSTYSHILYCKILPTHPLVISSWLAQQIHPCAAVLYKQHHKFILMLLISSRFWSRQALLLGMFKQFCLRKMMVMGGALKNKLKW
jgi:hypothetical protein